MNHLYKRLLSLCHANQTAHIGSYVSALEIIYNIYQEMNPEDIFILSSGHSALALFVVLEDKYGLDAQELYEKHGTHPKLDEKNHIFCSTGSLGMGITVAVGRALANKNRNVYVLITDGESNEGSVWESLRFAHDHKLDNLKIHCNANGWSAYDAMDIDYLERRLLAFHPDVVIHKTTVDKFGFSGLLAHYKKMTDADFEKALEML